MTMTNDCFIHKHMPPLLAHMTHPPRTSPCSVCCPPAPGTRIGVYRVRSAEGDWCGQRCSVRSVQSSSHLTGVCLVYSVYCIVYTLATSCGHRMASLLSCAPPAQPPALSLKL